MPTPSRFFRLLLVCLCFVLGTVSWAQQTLKSWIRVPIASTSIKMVRPEGYVATSNGLRNIHSETTIQVVQVSGPFTQMAKGFTAAKLSSQGLTLKGKSPVWIDGVAGLLVETEALHAGQHYGKWFLVLGNDDKTATITAQFPKGRPHEDALETELKMVLLNTTWSEG